MEMSKMHNALISVMKEQGSFVPEHEALLFLIGNWYQKWLTSDAKEISLKIPFYHKDVISSLIEYLYWLDLLIKIIAIGPVSDLSDAFLFDVRSYKKVGLFDRGQADFSIRHLSSNLRVHRFDKDILVSTDRFLPLFAKDQIDCQKDTIANVFALLNVIGRENLIPYAVKFDLDGDLTLFIKQTSGHYYTKAFSKMLCTESFRNDDDQRDIELDALMDTDIRRCIVFTYPYHVDVSSTVVNEFRERSKIFHIALSSRFAHTEVDEQELILTREEIGLGIEGDILKVIDRFFIKKTDCGAELITKLRTLRSEWNVAKFNSYSYPFPVKWLLCVHSDYTVEYWIEVFERDYPVISGQLLSDCRRIIELVYELNWIDRFLPDDKNITLVLPKAVNHSEVIFSLKDKLTPRFNYIVFTDEIDLVLRVNGHVCLLDPFNIVLLNNITLCAAENFEIVVPDFLFYTYQPFTRYFALKYHFDALIGGLRESLDEKFAERLNQWKLLKENVLGDSRKEWQGFFNNLAINDDNEEELLEVPPDVVSEFSDAELLGRVAVKERECLVRELPAYLYIRTNARELKLKPQTPVLLNLNSVLIRTIATVLDTDALFVPLDDVIKNLDLKHMINRLVTLSDDAQKWHQNLKSFEEKDNRIFDRLQRQGLSISKQTFDKDYLYSNRLGGLHIPRAKNDWLIICNCLKIKDSRSAWNIIKCRDDINHLRSVYSDVISLMISSGSFGINVSDNVLDQIMATMALLPDPPENENEQRMDAIALIKDICEKINLERIIQINEINI